jgi:hypothetical protein
MLSGDDIETDAWRAGVKAFLRKPEGIDELPSTLDRLLTQRVRTDLPKKIVRSDQNGEP